MFALLCFQSLQYQLGQTQRLADMYREQLMALEDTLAKIREEGDVGKELFKDRSEKMSKRLELMNQRYTDLERRRNLEVEGFKSDIKLLRARLKDLEKQLYKVRLAMCRRIGRATVYVMYGCIVYPLSSVCTSTSCCLNSSDKCDLVNSVYFTR